LPGGYAILQAIFDGFRLERLDYSTGALREGVLYDLVGRSSPEGVRDRTIRRFVERYHVDSAHAARVEATALHLLDRVRETWELGSDVARRMLTWAAWLHEIGIVVSYSAYHKHGGYLIHNSYMPGFSNDEQDVLAALVRVHRRKLPPVEEIPDLPPLGITGLLRLCVLLRLAVLLNRSRNPDPLPAFFLEAEVGKLRLVFAEGYLEEHPLTRADLAAEAALLAGHGFDLVVE
jgi:exopolyphosphatase/guanosine-5'-triphosphate,3'-diphosphate pyrophosphatase